MQRNRILAALVAAAALSATAPSGAASAEPDRPDASGTADVVHRPAQSGFGMGDMFTYNGQKILPTVAAEKGLSCNQEPSGTTCFDSQVEALAAGPGAEAQSARKSGQSKRRARASLVCSANDGRPLVLWESVNEGGWNVNMFTRGEWGNLGNPYFLNASAYRMGGHSGHMAEAANGGGNWYPGATGICDWGNMTGWSPSWNDRVSSRYRN